MGNRLYVGNLSFHTGEQTLRDAFSECGEVSDLRIVTDRETGRSRGFAFVTMSDARGASQAISQMNGAMVDGRDLRVNEAEERSNGGGREGRGFGGGGGGGYGGGGDRGFGGGRGRSF